MLTKRGQSWTARFLPALGNSPKREGWSEAMSYDLAASRPCPSHQRLRRVHLLLRLLGFVWSAAWAATSLATGILKALQLT